MTETVPKEMLIQKTFRRASIPDQGMMKLDIEKIPSIFGQLGQPYDVKKLREWVNEHDPEGTGLLDLPGYTELCKVFIKHPAAMAKSELDEFGFKSLINREDFAMP